MIDLHVHLDGSLSFEMVRKLAALQNMERYADEELFSKMVAPKDCQDLNDYLTKFDYPLQLLQTKEALELCTYELLRLQESHGLEYSEIRFAVKSTKYFLIKGWGVYFKESYTGWANVVMKNNGDGTWTVTIYGDVFTSSTSTVENPYTVTYTGNSIATILAAWESDEQASVYVTEIRGIKA